MEENNSNQFEYSVAEELKEKTQAYPVVDTKIVPVDFVKVPDIRNGGERNRKYAMYLSVCIIPDPQDGMVIPDEMPALLYDGDSLNDLLERAHAELDVIFEAAEDKINETTSSLVN